MKRILVVLAHPDLKNSRVNKRLNQEMEKHKEKITVHRLYDKYPDYNIDIRREQKLLEEYDDIVLQFPFYWYSSPSLLKKWIDEVLEYGWAYGDDDEAVYKLKGKKIGLAVTVGGPEKDYQKGGMTSYTIDDLLSPFMATISYIGAIHKGNFMIFDAVPETEDSIIDEGALRYVEFLFQNEE